MPTESPYPGQIATSANLRDMVQYVDAINAEDYNLMRAYIRDITATLGINPHGDAADLATRLDKALKADGTPRSPLKLLRVAKSLGDFTSINSAVASITDADYGNPYLVQVFPGLYEENVSLKSGVHIVALDPVHTQIKGKVSFSSSEEAWIHFSVPIQNLDSDGMEIDADDSFITISNSIYSDGGAALIAKGGTIFVKGNLESGGACPLVLDGATVTLDRNVISCNRNNAAGHCVDFQSGTLKAAFAVFQATHADAKAIYAATAKNVKLYGCWSNRALDANITNQITNGLTVDSNIDF